MEKDNTKFINFVYEYSRFHNNIINKLIHIVFVPMIWCTAEMFLLEYTPTHKLPFYIPGISDILCNPLNEISWTVPIGGSILVYYFFIDVGTAAITSMWCVPSYVIAVSL